MLMNLQFNFAILSLLQWEGFFYSEQGQLFSDTLACIVLF